MGFAASCVVLASQLETHQRMLAEHRRLRAKEIRAYEDNAQYVNMMRSIQKARASQCGCKNCGAPHEPVCSYCGTKATLG